MDARPLTHAWPLRALKGRGLNLPGGSATGYDSNGTGYDPSSEIDCYIVDKAFCDM